jgi:hypothetical protein
MELWSMREVRTMKSMDEEARDLAWCHYRIEEGVTQIYTITQDRPVESPNPNVIRLLEVNANTVPSGILPLQFGPSPASGIHYPSVIVEVTPEEFQQIQSDELKLPQGWGLGNLIPRPAADIPS